jgi:hypothetical protein
LIVPVGILEASAGTSTFRYVEGARTAGFRPLPGFPQLSRIYHEDFLFPFFEHRSMDPRRIDYPAFVAALGLGQHATRLDVLARSGGRRVGDKIRMQREPTIEGDGTTTCAFLVHGLQYAPDPAAAAAAMEPLRPNDQLDLCPDPDNPVNPAALLVTTPAGVVVGWVPDLLVEYVHIAQGNSLLLRVVQVNGPDLPAHLRLLVRVDGRVPPSFRPFSGGYWTPIASSPG